jgi:hypothetical protein
MPSSGWQIAATEFDREIKKQIKFDRIKNEQI